MTLTAYSRYIECTKGSRWTGKWNLTVLHKPGIRCILERVGEKAIAVSYHSKTLPKVSRISDTLAYCWVTIIFDCYLSGWFERFEWFCWQWLSNSSESIDNKLLCSKSPRRPSNFNKVLLSFALIFARRRLHDIKRPPVTGECHADFGDRVCKFFARSPANFCAYDLRHAWAIRAMSFGLDATLAAKQMGHSLATHTQTYHLALNEREQQRAYDRILTNLSLS